MDNVEQEKIREIIDSCRDKETGTAINSWSAAQAVYKYVSRIMQSRESAAYLEGQRSVGTLDQTIG